MIPLRVKLEGFLSYRDEAVLDFSGATLWMLRGPNGAGKSSVFDAISYALYGAHRGGVQGAESLIHHAASKLAVEFDFILGEDTFRVQRTLSRGSGGRSPRPSFQAWHLSGPSAPWPGQDGKQAIPETSSAQGLKKWVEATIGLSRETFCASVLLQQNKSDALLEADPSERHKMLSQIVDLSSYARVGDRAEALARERKALAEDLARRLANLEPVDESEIERLECAERSASARAGEAEAQGRGLSALRVHAENWNRLAGERRDIQAALQTASILLARRESIERDARRFEDLEQALPLLETVQHETQRAESLGVDESRENEAAQVLARQLEAATREVEAAQVLVDDLSARHQAAARRFEEAGAWLLEHSAALHDLKALGQAREQAQVLEAALADYPADLDAQAEDARARAEALASLNSALPHLQEWCAARSIFHDSRDSSRDIERTQREMSPRTDAARARCEAAAIAAEARTQDVNQTTQAVTRAQTLLQNVVESIARFEDVEGQAACRYCGQALTPEHRQAEAARLERERVDAQQNWDQSGKARDEAEQVLADARTEQRAASDELDALQNRERQAEQLARDARRDESDAVERASRAWVHLAPAQRSLLLASEKAEEKFTPEMLELEHPAPAQVLAWRAEAAGEAEARKYLQLLVAHVAARGRDLARREPVAGELARLQLAHPPEREQALRLGESHATREREDAGRQRSELSDPLAQSEAAHRDAQAARQKKADALSQAQSRAAGMATQRVEVERSLERLRDGLPTCWRQIVVPSAGALASGELEVRLVGWRQEANGLCESPSQLRDLNEVLLQNDRRQQRLGEVERDIEGVAPKARVGVAEVDAQRADIEKLAESAARERDEAGDKKRRLQQQRDEKQRLENEERAVERRSKLSRHLADLLGRDGLQRHLLQEAEAGIVDGANHVLDRLSGGSLRLELRALAGEAGQELDHEEQAASKNGEHAGGGVSEREGLRAASPPAKVPKALDLVARNMEVAGEAEGLALLPVAFLSGSQKFRVAVALALGIGQYASGGARRIESVIVDEGFGSLDKAGTREMIEELHSLGNTLARVIVVSHQDDFADAFSNRYSIELQDGTSRVSLQGRE